MPLNFTLKYLLHLPRLAFPVTQPVTNARLLDIPIVRAALLVICQCNQPRLPVSLLPAQHMLLISTLMGAYVELVLQSVQPAQVH